MKNKQNAAVHALLVLSLILGTSFVFAEEAPKAAAGEKPGAEQVELPGITIDAKNKRVDVSAKIALDAGLLELIACLPDTKEHESLVTVDAVPMHIHAALLLVGATNGHPARVKPANEEKTEWIHLPPRGDAILISLVIADPKDETKTIERPISDFLKRSERDPAFVPGDEDTPDDSAKVFDTFLFAGSVLVNQEDAERQYMADQSGHVVSISTFGDEVLCLPSRMTQENAALVWSVDDQYLPAVGTRVKLRLTLKEKPKEDAPR
ncbi:MAG: YdjY domain-containing protein [Phycisphaeraceae bacterium]